VDCLCYDVFESVEDGVLFVGYFVGVIVVVEFDVCVVLGVVVVYLMFFGSWNWWLLIIC